MAFSSFGNIEASHTVSAFPSGGIYAEGQIVVIQSIISNSTIYYTIDGTNPNNSSLQYTGPLSIDITTTLKFISVDLADNHTSEIVTEFYVIDTVAPTVIATKPEVGATRVDTLDTFVVNATFDEEMNATTINDETFTLSEISFEGGTAIINPISGTVQYDNTSNTASLVLDGPLRVGRIHTAMLEGNKIKDNVGNPLSGGDFVWNFTTGGQFTIVLLDLQATEPPGPEGSAFTFTPNPFTLNGSLTVEDNSELDADIVVFDERINGAITLRNVEYSSYMLTETTVPAGFAKVYDNVVLTVHETKPDSVAFLRNRDSAIQLEDITDPITVPAPDLNDSQFQIYRGNAFLGFFSGRYGEVPAGASEIFQVGPDAVAFASIATSDEALDQLLSQPPLALIFTMTAPSATSGEEIFEIFKIPTYPDVEESIAGDIVYFVPAYVIPYADSENNFVVTPVMKKVYPGMTLLMNQSSFVESELAEVKRINMTFDIEGNNIGFSFGISDTPPPGTPEPPLDAPALFLDIGFVGDVDFSDPSAFQVSPQIDIVVNKTITGFPELPNGCPDFRLLFFDGSNWVEVKKLDPTGNFTDFCPFTLEPEHFSKFAVGGVKGQTVSTENPPEEHGDGNRNGGGGSRSTGITQAPSGDDIQTTILTQSGTLTIKFETVQAVSGQLKVESNHLSAFEEIFEEIQVLEDYNEHGIVSLGGTTYSSAGDIFDIDASAINFGGMVDVTIPYDESAVTSISGSESDVRFLHYDEEQGIWEDSTMSVNELANTVTGRLDSLSPVIAAVIINQDITNSDQLIVSDPSFVFSEEVGRSSLSVKLNNMQQTAQNYAIIAQVLDQNDVVQHIEWQERAIAGAREESVYMSWDQMESGTYVVEVFIWTEMKDPFLLSQAFLPETDIYSTIR